MTEKELPVFRYIMAIYKAGSENGNLQKAIRSIQMQEGLGKKFEVVIHAVDDTFPDGKFIDDTANILKTLAAEDSRIIPTINQENLKLSRVRNFAISQTVKDIGDHDYLTFLDGDDSLEQGHLLNAVKRLAERPEIDAFHGQPIIDGDEDILSPYGDKTIINVHKTTFEGALFIRGNAIKQAYAKDQQLFHPDVDTIAVGHTFLAKLIVEHGMTLAYLPGCRVVYNRKETNDSATNKEKAKILGEQGIENCPNTTVIQNAKDILPYDRDNPETHYASSLLPVFRDALGYSSEQEPYPKNLEPKKLAL